jgi:hypothetical protein
MVWSLDLLRFNGNCFARAFIEALYAARENLAALDFLKGHCASEGG